MKFIAYVHSKRAKVEFEVESKVRTNVRGHYTYALCGHTDDGVRASTIVNKSQWDGFDVPVEERVVSEKPTRRLERRDKMQRPVKGAKPRNVLKKRAVNEDIERWLAEHYGIDLDSLDGRHVR